jgi:SNF2 family DNA or RNA helicase
MHKKALLLSEIGTGKTWSALWAADYLMRVGAIKKVLVLSPLSTLERVWGDAVFTDLTDRKAIVLHGSAEKRLKQLQPEADFYVINHDGFPIIAPHCNGMFDLIIIDEAAVLRNPSTTRFKQVRRFMANNTDSRLWLLTGTPTPNEPTDAWSLGKLVDNNTLGNTTYTAFRDKVMMKIGQWKFVPRPSSPETVKEILEPSIRYTRDECLELPDTVFHTRKVALSPEQKKYYKEMMKNLMVEASAGKITEANEAIKAQKLVQIACGAAYDENQQTIEIDARPRVSLVKDLVEESDSKCIVFVPLTGALRVLERELSAHFSCAVVNGEVSARDRNDIFRRFQKEPDPRVLIAHPATMAHGLTLTAASSIIWYGPITSNEIYQQANGRVERIGKRSVSNVFHIEATDLEFRMFERLRNKQKLQGVLLEMLTGEI